MISSTMPSAKYSCSESPLMFWNGRTAIDGLSGRLQRRAQGRRSIAGCGRAQAIGVNWPGDVLQVLLAHVLERQSDLAADFFVHFGRDANPAGLGNRLEPRRNVDPFTVNVPPLADHVTEVDADAQNDPAAFGQVLVRFRHLALQVGSAGNRVDRAAKLDKDTVAHDFDNAPSVRTDGRLHDRDPSFLQGSKSAPFVRFHEAAVANHVGHQHGGKAVFHERKNPSARSLASAGAAIHVGVRGLKRPAVPQEPARELKAASDASTRERTRPLAMMTSRVAGLPSGQASRWVGEWIVC